MRRMKVVGALSVVYLLSAAALQACERVWGMEYGEWLASRLLAAILAALCWRTILDIRQFFTIKEGEPKPNTDFLLWSFIIYMIFAGIVLAQGLPALPGRVLGLLLVGGFVVPGAVALLAVLGAYALLLCIKPSERD